MTRRGTRTALLLASVVVGVVVAIGSILASSGPPPEGREPEAADDGDDGIPDGSEGMPGDDRDEPDASGTPPPSGPTRDRGDDSVEPAPFPAGFEFDPSGGSLDPPLSTPLTADLPDPVVVRHDGAYYALGSNVGPFGYWTANIPVYRSFDLTTWEFFGDALPELPPWAAPGRTWAPGLVEAPEGGWVLYFTALLEAPLSGELPRFQCIGRAAGLAPSGPFTDASIEPLVCPRELGGAIDPSPFRNGETLWLHWKNDGNAPGADPGAGVSIFAQRLSADGLRVIDEPRRLIVCDCLWEGELVENPFMERDRQGRYWLFYSANLFSTDRYAIGVAECETPAGPCLKRSREGPWFESDETVSGPGGASLFRDADEVLYLAYHGWEPDAVGYATGGERSLRLARVRIEPAGPVAER